MKIEILLSLIGLLVTLVAAYIAYLQLKNSKKTDKPQQQVFEMLITGITDLEDISIEEIDGAIDLYELRPKTGYRKTILEMLKSEYQKKGQIEFRQKIDNILMSTSTLSETKEEIENTKNSSNRRGKMKIGAFIQECFRKAFEQNLITEDEIAKLQTQEYSKSVFNQKYEILRKNGENIKDELGYDRYYKRELFCGNYHLTSFWIESHRKPFKKWLKKIGFDENSLYN